MDGEVSFSCCKSESKMERRIGFEKAIHSELFVERPLPENERNNVKIKNQCPISTQKET